MYYIDNGDGSYTYYVKCTKGSWTTTEAIVVYSKDDIPPGYKEGTFIVEEKI